MSWSARYLHLYFDPLIVYISDVDYIRNKVYILDVMPSKVFSVRLPSESKERLERFARFQEKRPTEFAVQLLEEGLRRTEFPYIDFRSTPMGRLAYVEGSRVAVWFVERTYHDFDKDAKATAEHYQWPVEKVKAAIHYAESFPEEMQRAAADHQLAEKLLRNYLPALEEVVTRP